MTNKASYKPKQIVRLLKQTGFQEIRQVGSHLHLYNQKTQVRVTVPMHNRDLKRKTLMSIIKTAGLTI